MQYLQNIKSPKDIKQMKVPELKQLAQEIRKELNFTSLKFHRLDDMVESIGISPCKLCTYCWSGKE